MRNKEGKKWGLVITALASLDAAYTINCLLLFKTM